MIADRRLYLNADKTAVVEEHDPDASFLLAAAGSEIPREHAHLVTDAPVDDDPAETTVVFGNVDEPPAEPTGDEPPAEKSEAAAPEKPSRKQRGG